MIGILLLATLTPLLVPATPVPAQAALPEIGRVRSNALCTALRANIAPTVAGLMKNDEIIGAGHRAFAKMAHDRGGYSSAPIEIDKLYLQQVESRLVHNLKLIDTLLSDRKRFAAEPKTDDEREANALRNQLTAVAASQHKALDLVSSTLATEELGQLQGDLSGAMQTATGKVAPLAAPTSDPVSFIGVAGLPEYSPASNLPTTAAKSSSLAGHTPYDSIAAVLEETQTNTAEREKVASTAVITAAAECRGNAVPQPSATPTKL